MTEITILLVDGGKTALSLDQIPTDSKSVTIQDVYSYLIASWQELFPTSTIKPTNIQQFQLISMGMKLKPAKKVEDLDLEVSRILHLVIKPLELIGPDKESRFNSFKSKLARRNSEQSAVIDAPRVNEPLQVPEETTRDASSSGNAESSIAAEVLREPETSQASAALPPDDPTSVKSRVIQEVQTAQASVPRVSPENQDMRGAPRNVTRERNGASAADGESKSSCCVVV